METKHAEYVAAKNAWKAAIQEEIAANETAKKAVKQAQERELAALQALIAVQHSLSPAEVAEADEQWRKQWRKQWQELSQYEL